jgi:protein-tyrosine phosphatase
MTYGVTFLIFAVACGATAAAAGGLAWLLLWPTVSFFLASAAFFGMGPALMGKQPTGRIAPWAWCIQLPYFAVSGLVWYCQRWFGTEDCHNQVAPGLWVGRRAFSNELPPGVDVVVDLTAELEEPRDVACNGRTYFCLPTLDASVPDERRLRELVRYLADHRGGIYLHCAQGRGRSAMLAAAVLIERGQAASVEEAEALMQRARPTVQLSRAQRRLIARVAQRRTPDVSPRPAMRQSA